MYQVLKCKQTLTSLGGGTACERFVALLTHWIPPPGPSCLQISLQKAQRDTWSHLLKTLLGTQKNVILDMVACDSDNEKCDNGSIAVT